MSWLSMPASPDSGPGLSAGFAPIGQQEKDWLYEQMTALPGASRLSALCQFYLLAPYGRREADGRPGRRLARLTGFLIRDCANYPGLTAAYGRNAVRPRFENERFVEKMREKLSKF